MFGKAARNERDTRRLEEIDDEDNVYKEVKSRKINFWKEKRRKEKGLEEKG